MVQLNLILRVTSDKHYDHEYTGTVKLEEPDCLIDRLIGGLIVDSIILD